MGKLYSDLAVSFLKLSILLSPLFADYFTVTQHSLIRTVSNSTSTVDPSAATAAPWYIGFQQGVPPTTAPPPQNSTSTSFLTGFVQSTASSYESIAALAIWALYMTRAFNDNPITGNYGRSANLLVFGLVIVKVAWFAAPTLDLLLDFYNLLWVVPIAANLLYDYLYEKEAGFLQDVLEKEDSERPETVDLNQRAFAALWFVTTAWSAGRVAYFFFDSQFVYAIYCGLDGVLGFFLVVNLAHMQTSQMQQLWIGSGILIPIYAAYQLVTLVSYFGPWYYGYGMLVAAFFTLCISVLCNKSATRAEHQVFEVCIAPIELTWNGARDLLMSASGQQILYVIGAAYITFSIYSNDPWYVSHTTFNEPIPTSTCVVSNAVDKYAQPFFDYTNIPYVRDAAIAASAVGAVAAVRNALRSFVGTVYPHVYAGCHGFRYVVYPGTNVVVLLAFLLLLYVVVFIVLSTFPAAERIVSTPSFWASAVFCSTAHLIVTQLLADMDATVWAIAGFAFTQYSRQYTYTGFYVLLVQCGLVLVSVLALTAQYAGQFHKRLGASSKGADETVRLIVLTTEEAIERLTSPATICLAGAVLVFVLAIPTGSPFQDFHVQHTTAYNQTHPDYASYSKTDVAADISGALNAEVNLVIGLTSAVVNSLDNIGSFTVPVIGTKINVAYFVGSLVSYVTDLLTGLAHQIADNLPLTGGLGDMLEQLSFINAPQFRTFNILQSLNFLDAKLPNFNVSVEIPVVALHIDLLQLVNAPPSWLIWLLVGVGAMLAAAKVFSTFVPALSSLDSVLVAGVGSLVITAGAMILNANGLMNKYGYEFYWKWSSSAGLYGISLLLFVASGFLAHSTTTVGLAKAMEEEEQALRGAAQVEVRNRIYYDPARSTKKEVPNRESIQLALHRRTGRKYALNLVTERT